MCFFFSGCASDVPSRSMRWTTMVDLTLSVYLFMFDTTSMIKMDYRALIISYFTLHTLADLNFNLENCPLLDIVIFVNCMINVF